MLVQELLNKTRRRPFALAIIPIAMLKFHNPYKISVFFSLRNLGSGLCAVPLNLKI